MKEAQRRKAPRVRPVAAAMAALLVPLGLGTKAYRGPGEAWVHGYAGDLLFGAFWLFVVKSVWPAFPSIKAGLLVSALCCLIEVTQLIRAPGLNRFRGTFMGHVLLGSGFEMADMTYYALGAAVAVGMIRGVERGASGA